MKRRWYRGMSLLGLLALSACTETAGVNTCVPSQVVACPCTGGGVGTQTCLADGTYGTCMCPTVDAGQANDGGALDVLATPDVVATLDAVRVDDVATVRDVGTAAEDVAVDRPAVDGGSAPDAGMEDYSPENPFATDPDYESVLGLGGVDGSRQPYGTDLGSYRGVVARSNYVGGCEPSPECFFGIEAPRTMGTYGYQYQCVEYVVRFYASALRYPGLRGSGDAIQYWNGPHTDAARRLERYANGGTVPPQPDDMIIFEGGRYGHIAVVRAVTADSVHIIQQNWFHNRGDGDHRLAMTVSGGRYTVAPLATNGRYRVLGWRRVPGTTRQCPSLDCSGNGACNDGVCACNSGYTGANCDRCAAGFEGYPRCVMSSPDPCTGRTCSMRGTCTGGVCRCDPGHVGDDCERCAVGYVQQGARCVMDPCASITCSARGTCSAGRCQCNPGYTGDACERCASGYVRRGEDCVLAPTESCNGRDDDGNGVVDDPFSCWRAIYRFVQDSTGARCLGPSLTVPTQCPGYRFEREAFIVATTASADAYRAVQCSRGTDHIVVDSDSSDRNDLIAARYDCSLELGYIYRNSPGRTPFSNVCPLWRYRYTVSGGSGAHLFTRGNDAVSAFTCEPPARGWVTTGDTCFGTRAPGCP